MRTNSMIRGKIMTLPRLLTSLLLLLGGGLVGGIFAQVSLHGRPEQGKIVASVYAADLLGACLGSLLAGLFLVPFFGMAGAACGAAVLCLAAVVMQG